MSVVSGALFCSLTFRALDTSHETMMSDCITELHMENLLNGFITITIT
jgi:hypothetical protein